MIAKYKQQKQPSSHNHKPKPNLTPTPTQILTASPQPPTHNRHSPTLNKHHQPPNCQSPNLNSNQSPFPAPTQKIKKKKVHGSTQILAHIKREDIFFTGKGIYVDLVDKNIDPRTQEVSSVLQYIYLSIVRN
jgi:hypothetical protein